MLQDEKVLKISFQGRLVVYLVAAIYSLKKNYRFESHFCLREKCSRMTVDWKTKRPKNNKGRLVLMVAQLHNCHTVKESGDQIPLKIKNYDLKIKNNCTYYGINLTTKKYSFWRKVTTLVLTKLCPSHPVWPNLVKFKDTLAKFEILRQLFEELLAFGIIKYRNTMAKICDWAEFDFHKWPNIEKIICRLVTLVTSVSNNCRTAV